MVDTQHISARAMFFLLAHTIESFLLAHTIESVLRIECILFLERFLLCVLTNGRAQAISVATYTKWCAHRHDVHVCVIRADVL